MKTSQSKSLIRFSQTTISPRFRVLPLCLAMSILASQGRSESVDSELVLLVDIVRPELSQTNFTRLMNSYATAFTSSQMLDSIQSGVTGKIAVSLMFYGGTGNQVVGVPWMMISNANDALGFANLVQAATRPTTFAFSNPASALTAAAQSFGSETGGAGNGFESAVQVIEIATAGIPSNSMAAATANSSANALASGVDLINVLALGTYSNAIDNFYTANVIGSTIPGVTATSNTSALNNSLAAALNAEITTTVGAGANASVNAVPEPSSLATLSAAALLLFRRRRA